MKERYSDESWVTLYLKGCA